MLCRSAHSQENIAYNCIQCKISFTNWNNFKRHNREKHEELGRFKCVFCNFKTNRGETLRRHAESSHRIEKVVSDILHDLIDEVASDGSEEVASHMLDVILTNVFDKVQTPMNDDNDSGAELEVDPNLNSDFQIPERVRARDEWVAAIQAEFRRSFPRFEDEVRELRVQKKKRKVASKVLPTVASRRSSRLQRNSHLVTDSGFISDSGDMTTDVENEAQVSEEISDDIEVVENNIVSSSDHGDDQIENELSLYVDVEVSSDCLSGKDLPGKFACISCERVFR